MDFLTFLDKNLVCLDGGMGTLLQAQGLMPGEKPEMWNIIHPEVITKIHTDYFNAGSNVVSTNTFGANVFNFNEDELEKIISSAIQNAKNARAQSAQGKEKFIALDIGPTGRLLKPLGDLDFEEAVNAFAKTVKLGVKYGVDLILIETMNDSFETKAAVLAAKENCNLPVFVSNAYSQDGKLVTGATPEAMVSMLEGLSVTAIGANCSLGPKQLKAVAQKLLDNASIPVFFKPNAGMPKNEGEKTVFDVTVDEFANEVASVVKSGVRAFGGCCGTTPEYIKAVSNKLAKQKPLPIVKKNKTVVSSYSKAVEFLESPLLIGERINPTGKKRLKQALIENDIDYILAQGVLQQEKGVDILDVNVGLPEIDEPKMLKKVVFELQSVSDLPLQIDTANACAMENALRIYNGKPLINSVNGKQESMDAIFPLVKKYGGVLIALTLDENGIPQTAEGRVKIAKKIISEAQKWGIDKKDIVFDTLAMTISADPLAAKATLDALEIIKNELGCHVSLGVSNVSFGLPNRDAINSTFFAVALEKGLSCAIMNPNSTQMLNTYYAYKAIKGLDENFEEYIAKSASLIEQENVQANIASENEHLDDLEYAIKKGFKERAADITKTLLKTENALEIVNNKIIPALNQVGIGFEEKKVFLPQLLISAEAAKCAFEEIKAFMANEKTTVKKCPFVLATVKGDIHDIGKNIVKLLLENYGFDVVDLGKDVAPEEILAAVKEKNAYLVGLSALMTTTVPAMEDTIKLLNKEAPNCKIVVGGAVLTKEYAEKIKADRYAKDAMEAVRFAEEEFDKNK